MSSVTTRGVDESLQVTDDQALLDRMMSHLAESDELYRPTNYWAFYERSLVPELKACGLRNFRRHKGNVIRSFSATDPAIGVRVSLPLAFRGMGRLSTLLNATLHRLPIEWQLFGLFNPTWVIPYFHRVVRAKFEALGWDLRKCPTSLWGNPEEVQEIDGVYWSRQHLAYCSMVADAARHIDFRTDSIICELGSGMGRNAEVLAHLFGDATILLFDIPPQLYVAHQYLAKVFGSRVMPYDEAIAIELPADGSIPERARGRIVISPSWRMPAWSRTRIDGFWNSASFQEMEPDVVENYLRLVRSMRPEWIYINAFPDGISWGPRPHGGGGTKQRVLSSHYDNALKQEYQLLSNYETDYLLTQDPGAHRSFVYGRRNG